MVHKQKESNWPTWLNLKNIGYFLSLLGLGTGVGYVSQPEPEKEVVEKKVVESFNAKELLLSAIEYTDMCMDVQKKTNQNIQGRIDDTQDEYREEIKKFIKKIDKAIEKIDRLIVILESKKIIN